MCTHRSSFATDQEFVDALKKDVVNSTERRDRIAADPTSSPITKKSWETYVKIDTASAQEFQKLVDAGTALTDDVMGEVFDRVYAAEANNTLDQLIAAPTPVSEPVAA